MPNVVIVGEAMLMKPIPEYPGYFAGRDGHIYSNRCGYMRRLPERTHGGYLRVNVRDGGKPVKTHVEPVHKLILEAFVEKRPAGYVCRHLNGIPTDNRPANLRWGTPSENVRDSIRHGTAACLRRGEASVAAKLREEDIYTIRRMYREGHLQREIAGVFSISQRHVSDIVRGKTWTHLKG